MVRESGIDGADARMAALVTLKRAAGELPAAMDQAARSYATALTAVQSYTPQRGGEEPQEFHAVVLVGLSVTESWARAVADALESPEFDALVRRLRSTP